MLYLNCGELISVDGFSGRMSYSPRAKFSSNMGEFDFYEINSYLLKLYQNDGIKVDDLINFFRGGSFEGHALGIGSFQKYGNF